jgi:hypothetical protein
MEMCKCILVFPDRSVDMEALPLIPRVGEFIQRKGERLHILAVTYDTTSKPVNILLDVEALSSQ